jgi:hypothetical protein
MLFREEEKATIDCHFSRRYIIYHEHVISSFLKEDLIEHRQ